jgi:hypothetical protein
MKRREKILLIFLVSAVVGWRGLPVLRAMVLGRLDEDSRKIAALKVIQTKLEDETLWLQIKQRRVNDWIDRSLPPEPVEAQRLYQEWVHDLAELVAGLSSVRVTPEPLQVTPNASFRAVRVSVKGEGTFEQLTYFLHEFYRADLLHRVQALKVEGPPNPGGPLKITMMVEGLCLPDAPPRTHLFPRTTLADSLPRSFDTLKVNSAEEFPKEPPFMIQIDNEFATVTKIAGNKWTVKRAIEGTSKAYHAAKAEVELFPVKFEQKNVTLDDRRKTLVKHPFVQPVPPAVQVVDTNDPALQTKLMATILTEVEPVAFLFNSETRFNTVVHKGTAISVGDVEGTVVAIEQNSIEIKRDNGLWRLAIGKDLRSMTRGDSNGPEDSPFTGYSDEPPDGRGSDPRIPGGRDRFRSRRGRRSEINFDSRP